MGQLVSMYLGVCYDGPLKLVKVYLLTFGAAADQTDPWLDHFSYAAIKRVSCSALDQ
jgi:hypothetical protein